MNCRNIFFFGILTLSVSCSSAPDTQVGPFTVSTIIENVYRIEDYNDVRPRGRVVSAESPEGFTENNCSDIFLLVGDKEALVVDLCNPIHEMWDPTAIESLQKIVSDRIGDRRLIVTVTHSHSDHLGMLPAFIDRADFWLPAEEFRDLVSDFPEGFPMERTVFFEDGEKLRLSDDLLINTLVVPGHTKASTVYHLVGKDIILSGDAVGCGNGVWIFSKEGFGQYIDGLDKFIAWVEDEANGIDLDALTLYSGHTWQVDCFMPEGSKMGYQYLMDMDKLVDLILAGESSTRPVKVNLEYLDTQFEYGIAAMTWNLADAMTYGK